MGDLRTRVVEAERSHAGRSRARGLRGAEIAFGVVLPLVCLLADPCIFAIGDRPILGLGPDPYFPHWRAAAWAFVLLECGALVAHAWWPPRRGVAHALFGGLFLIGALAAFGLAVVLAPLSIVGAFFMGIGLLGLVPFFTAAVFLHRGVAALGRGRVWRGRLAPLAVLVGMAVGLGVPVAAWGAGRVITRNALFALERGDRGGEERATAKLRRWRFLIYPDDLVLQYLRTPDTAVQGRIAIAYKQLTGREIEQRLEERQVLVD